MALKPWASPWMAWAIGYLLLPVYFFGYLGTAWRWSREEMREDVLEVLADKKEGQK